MFWVYCLLKRKSREEEEQLSNSTNNSRDIIIIDLIYQITQMLLLYLRHNCLFFARLVAKDSHSRVDKNCYDRICRSTKTKLYD